MKRQTVVGIALALALLVLVVGFALYPLARKYGLNWGSYYTQVDNTRVSAQVASDGMDHSYDLTAYSESGDRIDVTFLTERELRDGAYLKLDVLPLRGVVSWEEVPADGLPAAVGRQLGAR